MNNNEKESIHNNFNLKENSFASSKKRLIL